jgi:hypothetical protein
MLIPTMAVGSTGAHSVPHDYDKNTYDESILAVPEERQRKRMESNLKRKVRQLGYQLIPMPSTIPSGTVTFTDGANPLATVSLASGKASHSTTTSASALTTLPPSVTAQLTLSAARPQPWWKS